MRCPLCDKEEISFLEKTRKNDLVHLYKKMTGINFSYLINQDFDFCKCENCSLKFYYPLLTGDEKFYNALQKFDWYYADEKNEYHYAKKYISSRDRVLEVGSGKGAFAKHLPTGSYTGLDFSKAAKELAAQNGITIENALIQDYAKQHQEQFDVVVSFQVLEHVSDPKSFIESQLLALKNGGKLIIAVPSEDSFLKYITNGILNMPPHHVTRWSDATFEYIASHYNLKITDLYHEEVQDVHKRLYANTLVSNAISTGSLIDLSIGRRLISRIASLLSRLFVVHGLKREMLPNGHTVLVVFEK